MMDSSAILKQIQLDLNQGDVTTAISLVDENDLDIDYRDVTHDLQTILMKLCYIELSIDDLQTVLEVMFNKFPDVNIQDAWGRTFLMHACIANKPCIIEALLEYDATDVTVIDFDGNSALSYAVQNCDVFTLEDILRHENGPKLLTLYNAKGQSPYTTAEKSGDKQILKLFDAYVNKSIGLREKRNRKSKHRDAIKLPPAYASSPRDVCITARANTARYASTDNKISCDLRLRASSNDRLSKLKLSVDKRAGNSDGREPIVKCDSAPVMRSSGLWQGRDEFMTSLSLTSPRLTRHHHRQDSLYSEPLPLNKNLPPMKSLKASQNSLSSDTEIPDGFMRRGRRPSVSLPDLRNVSGSLISSGTSSPNTDSELEQQEEGCDEEDVFAQSYPNNKPPLNSSRRSKSKATERQMTLPEINAGLTSLTSKPKNRKGISPLARQRKYSNSDDQLQKVLVQPPT